MSDAEDKGLKFGLDNSELAINHWFLNNRDAVMAVAETPEWKEKRELIARVTVNGVEFSFKSLDDFILSWGEQIERSFNEKYADLNKEVQRRLEERIKEEGQPILDKLYEIQRALEDPSELLVPYWDRKDK